MNVLIINDLRMLLVGRGSQADRLTSNLASFEHSLPMLVPDLNEASEALSLQKFEAVFLIDIYPAEQLTGFASLLAGLAAKSGPRPILLACPAVPDGLLPLDASVTEPFDARELTNLIRRLEAERNAGDQKSLAGEESRSEVFLAKAFEEQCAHERNLMIEILDLFQTECQTSLPEMEDALRGSKFEELARAAHSLKGSLGSLHAPASHKRVSALEQAAKASQGPLCRQIFDGLKFDLEHLEEQLLAFRETCLGR